MTVNGLVDVQGLVVLFYCITPDVFRGPGAAKE
jgi:hypothetical protein